MKKTSNSALIFKPHCKHRQACSVSMKMRVQMSLTILKKTKPYIQLLIQVDDVVAEDTRGGNASRKLFSQRKGHDAKRTKPGRTEEMKKKKTEDV